MQRTGDNPDHLTYSRILRFWLPLAATWIMMSAEGPFLAALIARLDNAGANLAAYGVAYAFALVAEAPIIMLLSAATALARNRVSYLRLRNFTSALNLLVTASLLIFLLPPAFTLCAEALMGLPAEVAGRTHGALLLLLPWPAAIGFRRFYQGVLIRQGQTRRVAVSTVLRLTVMGGSAFLLCRFGALEGAMVGACALSIGVVAEALGVRWMARKAIRQILATEPESPEDQPDYRSIASFYLPLALTPFIGLSVHPMVTFFLGQGRFPLESLAVMPVLYSLTFVFRAVGLSLPEVAIALIGERPGNYRRIRNFALCLASATTAALALIAFSPLAMVWFRDISGLSPELASFAVPALQIMAVLPGLSVLLNFQRALLTIDRATVPVSIATAVEAFGIFSLLMVLVVYFSLPGATAAATAFLLGRLGAIALLAGPCAGAVRKIAGHPRQEKPPGTLHVARHKT